MMEIIGVLKVEESLVISFVVKILKRGVLKVDDSQGNEWRKGDRECCRVYSEGDLSGGGER